MNYIHKYILEQFLLYIKFWSLIKKTEVIKLIKSLKMLQTKQMLQIGVGKKTIMLLLYD